MEVQGLHIDIYDGTTVVESLHAASSGETDLADFGWINEDGLNVTTQQTGEPDTGIRSTTDAVAFSLPLNN